MQAILDPTELQYASQEVIASRLRNLRSIQFANHPELTDAEFQQLLSHCPQLQTLEIHNCNLIGDATLRFLADKPLRLLSWVGASAATEEGFHHLFAHSQTLASLNVSGTPFSTRLCKTLLSTSPTLAALDVSFCPLSDEAFQEIRAPLQYLNLQGCASITDATLRSLSRTHLRHLCLAYNTKITPAGLKTLHLQTLRVSHCPQLEDEEMRKE